MAKPIPTDPPVGETIALLMPMTFAADVEGRTSRIALVHRRVDLDELIVAARRDVARPGRNESRPSRYRKPERVAHRDHPLPDARRLVGDFDRLESRATIYLEQRNAGRSPRALPDRYCRRRSRW
jgi:hypothetical protein